VEPDLTFTHGYFGIHGPYRLPYVAPVTSTAMPGPIGVHDLLIVDFCDLIGLGITNKYDAHFSEALHGGIVQGGGGGGLLLSWRAGAVAEVVSVRHRFSSPHRDDRIVSTMQERAPNERIIFRM